MAPHVPEPWRAADVRLRPWSSRLILSPAHPRISAASAQAFSSPAQGWWFFDVRPQQSSRLAGSGDTRCWPSRAESLVATTKHSPVSTEVRNLLQIVYGLRLWAFCFSGSTRVSLPPRGWRSSAARRCCRRFMAWRRDAGFSRPVRNSSCSMSAARTVPPTLRRPARRAIALVPITTCLMIGDCYDRMAFASRQPARMSAGRCFNESFLSRRSLRDVAVVDLRTMCQCRITSGLCAPLDVRSGHRGRAAESRSVGVWWAYLVVPPSAEIVLLSGTVDSNIVLGGCLALSSAFSIANRSCVVCRNVFPSHRHSDSLIIFAAGLTLWLFLSRWVVLTPAHAFLVTVVGRRSRFCSIEAAGSCLRERMHRWLGFGILACAIVRVFSIRRVEARHDLPYPELYRVGHRVAGARIYLQEVSGQDSAVVMNLVGFLHLAASREIAADCQPRESAALSRDAATNIPVERRDRVVRCRF